jgi:hypothetical protein
MTILTGAMADTNRDLTAHEKTVAAALARALVKEIRKENRDQETTPPHPEKKP